MLIKILKDDVLVASLKDEGDSFGNDDMDSLICGKFNPPLLINGDDIGIINFSGLILEHDSLLFLPHDRAVRLNASVNEQTISIVVPGKYFNIFKSFIHKIIF